MAALNRRRIIAEVYLKYIRMALESGSVPADIHKEVIPLLVHEWMKRMLDYKKCTAHYCPSCEVVFIGNWLERECPECGHTPAKTDRTLGRSAGVGLPEGFWSMFTLNHQILRQFIRAECWKHGLDMRPLKFTDRLFPRGFEVNMKLAKLRHRPEGNEKKSFEQVQQELEEKNREVYLQRRLA